MTKLTTLPAPISFIKQMDDKSLHTDTWTHGEYELISRRYCKADGTFTDRRWSARCGNRDLPGLYNNAPFGSDEIEFGVNWAAMGTKSPDETRAYGHVLLNAAYTADYFNGIIRLANSLPDRI